MLPHLLILTLLTRLISCGPRPLLQWDPATASDCAGWYDNDGGDSCASIRKTHGISPAEFHAWNPSVSLDCAPWDHQSYCIITQEKLDRLPQSSSSSSVTPTRVVPSTTAAETKVAPSPTAWEAIGCYAEVPDMPVLEENTTPEGDEEMGVGKCQDRCYERGYEYAGLQEGDQCWCSGYVGGERAEEQGDCNVPCAGKGDEICGGKGVLGVYKAMGDLEFVSTATTTAARTTGTGMGTETGMTMTTTTTISIVSEEGAGSSASPVTTAVTGAAGRIGVLGEIWG